MNTERLNYLLDELNHEINRLRTEIGNMAREVDGGACSAPQKEWSKPDDPMFAVRGPWNNWGKDRSRWDHGGLHHPSCENPTIISHDNGFTAECLDCGADLT